MKRVAVTILLSGLLAVTACGQTRQAVGEDEVRTVDSGRGRSIEIPAEPRRIVDLSGSTEELLVLGVNPAASANADYGDPKQFSPTIKERLSADTVNLGWYGMPIDLEVVASVKPDLILLGKLFNEELYEQLSKIAPTVQVPHPYYEWRERLVFLAGLFGEEDKERKWLAEYDQKAEEWKSKLQPAVRDETFAVIETYPGNIVIYSLSGVAEIVYRDMGLKPAEGIPEPEPWGGLETSLEALTSVDPDHLIFLENSENKMEDSPVWSSISAVKKGNVYKITNVDNYNYAFTALGRMELLDRIGTLIMDKQS
ncbi:ABC transporter substrate-binding protein [Cohnella sp.]|uniref:ABC transporter substrate-binding protein n=1 Tax=Cohnella sp. TaxID=1883426 RepID=UPI0035644265